MAGKVAVVTGASAGIGAAVSHAFVREGARVVLVARTDAALSELAARLGGAATCVAGDVANPATAVAASDQAERMGGLDVLVNNAGIDLDAPLLDTPAEQTRRVFEVNFFGALSMLQEAARRMAGAGGGSIVNVSSRTATAGVPGMAVYGATKGALESLSRAAAIELAAQQVRVNVIAPGLTRTRMNEEWLAGRPNPEAFLDRVLQTIPQRRLGLPEDVAAAAIYLASDESRHVTGATLAVDGGYTAA
ncbi:MAG: SDR family oxidoreductase [Candidatus Dormibacteraeota bacterium]|nr:SDR family oxidoreductase [Candidatus Dormibacteraeota bacterium]